MTSIVAGLNLGIAQSFINSSQGNANIGTDHAVNVATGNLSLLRQDGFVKGKGHDLIGLQVYNSQGQWSNNSAFTFGVAKITQFPSGSNDHRLILQLADGSTRTFKRVGDTDRYQALTDKDAIDEFRLVNDEWLLDDGATDSTWHFNLSGQLTKKVDGDDHTTNYTYTEFGELEMISNGLERLEIDYNPTNRYISDLTAYDKDGNTLSYVAYGYDQYGRLDRVAIDLSPSDNNIDNGKLLTSTYTYDGTSQRIASITKNDGRQTRFQYDSQGRTTHVYEGDNR